MTVYDSALDWELAGRIVAFLNDLVELDKPAVAALIANRVPCSQAMADHPTVQVGGPREAYRVGMLGILNGLCGIDSRGWGGVVAVYDGPDGALVKFRVVEVSSQ